MPARDATGPLGNGPTTGHGLGRCNQENSSKQGYLGRGCGRTRRRGSGFRFGRGVKWGCPGYRSSISLEEEKQILENRLASIETTLNKDKDD